MKKIAWLLFFVVHVHCLFAQSKIQEGKVFYDITYPALPESMKAYQSMLPSDATLYFKQGKSRVEMPNPMGKLTTITDSLQKNITVLMNLPGHKIALRKTKEEMRAVEEDMLGGKSKPKTRVILQAETKKIAGYLCHRAVIFIGNDTINQKSDCWYTTDLPPLMLVADSGLEDLPGMIMEYNLVQEGIESHVKVRQVFTEKIGDILFEIPPGYKVVTEQELVDIMNGK